MVAETKYTFTVQVDWDVDGSFDGPLSANRITNGDFASGETGWTFFGGIEHQVSGGKLEAYRNGGTAASFYQDFAYTVAPDDEFAVSFKVANTSAGDKQITVRLWNPDESFGPLAQVIDIPGSTAEYTESFTLSSSTPGTWGDTTRFEVLIETDDNLAELTFDDISVTTTHSKDDITADVREIHAFSGFGDNPLSHVADTGTCRLVLNNASRAYSPANTAGPHYGKQWINCPVRIQVMYTGLVSPKTVWQGYIQDVRPAPGDYGPKTCVIYCEDMLGLYARAPISVVAQENLTMAQALNMIGAEVFKADRASGTITFSGTGSDGDTITVGERVYTLRASVGGTEYEVLIGADATETARNLTAAINDDYDAAEDDTQLYGDNTFKSREVSAAAEAGVITLLALNRGTLGNGIALAETSADCAVSGGTLSGGTDGPSGLTDYATGTRTFDVAGDQWSEERTTARRALTEVVESEFGYAWVSRAGKLTTWDKNREFVLPSLKTGNPAHKSAISFDGNFGGRVYNRVTVNFQPRGYSDTQVIAKANNVLAIPGLTDGGRWNREIGYPNSEEAAALDAGVKVVRLPFVESDTGNVVGAKDVITPRKGVDYTINDERSGEGYNYTNDLPPLIRVSVVVTGSGVECTFSNYALGTLYLFDFQVRGTATIGYDTQQIIRENAVSIGKFQRSGITYNIALPSGEDFAEQIAYYLVGRYKTPSYRAGYIDIPDARQAMGVGGAFPMSLDIGTDLLLEDTQTAIDHEYYVRSIQMDVMDATASAGPRVSLRWGVKRIDDTTYWILGDATYGVLGSTTRLGL